MPNNQITSFFIVDVSYFECLVACHDICRAKRENSADISLHVRKPGDYSDFMTRVKDALSSNENGNLLHIWFVGFDDPFLRRLLENLNHQVGVLNGNPDCSIRDQLALAIRKTCPDWKPDPIARNDETGNKRIIWEQLEPDRKIETAESRYGNGNAACTGDFSAAFDKLVPDHADANGPQQEQEEDSLSGLTISKRLFDTGRKTGSNSNEPALRLLLARDNDEIVPWLVPEKEEYRLTLISHTSNDTSEKATLKSLFFSCPLTHARNMGELSEAIGQEALALDLDVQFLRRQDSMFLSVSVPGDNGPRKEQWKYLDQLADRILDSHLLGARPVPRWRSSFLVGFRDADRAFFQRSIEREEEKVLEHDTAPQEGSLGDERRGYFLPEIQGLLMPEGSPRDARERRFFSFRLASDLAKKLKIEVENGNYASSLSMQLRDVKIHFNPGHTFWLEWSVEDGRECETPKPEDDKKLESATFLAPSNKVLWRHYLLRKEKDKNAWSLARVLDFNAEARLNFFDYMRLATDKEQSVKLARNTLHGCDASPATDEYQNDPKLPEQGFPVGEISRALICRVFGKQWMHDKAPVQLTDSRSRIVSSLVVDGAAPVVSPARDGFEAICARLATADPYGIGWPYDPSVSRKELEQAAYKRFWSWGSRFMIMDHCFSFLGFRHHEGLPAPREGEDRAPRPAFAEDPIHDQQMAGPYSRLYRFFLAIEANMRDIAMRLSRLEAELPDHRAVPANSSFDRLQDLRHELDRLSARFIHAHVSSQVQGRELVAKMREQFDIERTWDELNTRVCRAESQWRTVRQTHHETRMGALYLLGTLTAILFGLKGLAPEADSSLALIWSLVERMGCNLAGLPGMEQEAAMPLALVLSALSVWLLAMIIVDAVACCRSTGRVRGGGWKRPVGCVFAWFRTSAWRAVGTAAILVMSAVFLFM